MFTDLCWKNIYPFSSHSSMVQEGKWVENLQYESFLNHLGAQLSTGPMIIRRKSIWNIPRICCSPPNKRFTRKFTRLVCTVSALVGPTSMPPKTPCKTRFKPTLPWFLQTIFATEKWVLLIFFLGGGNSNMFNFHLDPWGNHPISQQRIFFQMAWRFNPPTSFGWIFP